MAVPAGAARSLLEAVRYLQRGTRFRRSVPRLVSREVAGYVRGGGGDQRPVGTVRLELREIVAAAGLDDLERLVVDEFFGLSAYPSELTGLRGLTQSVAAGRTKVEEQIAAGAAAIARVLEARPHPHDHPLVVERDPFTVDWAKASPQYGELDESTVLELHRAVLVAAFDLVDRSESASAIQAAIVALGRHHDVASDAGIGPTRFRQEHRNAAKAACSIAFSELLDHQDLPERLVAPTLFPPLGLEQLATTGRTATHHSLGQLDATLDADEFVILVGEVFECRDPDGAQADVAMEVFLSGRDRILLGDDVAETVTYAFARGLAAAGSWRIVELARWFTLERPLTWTTVSLSAWAAHVASLHLHDHIAWRLCRVADRQLSAVAARNLRDERKRQLMIHQIELVRSGCRFREADRWYHADRPSRAVQLLGAAQGHLERSRLAFVDAAAPRHSNLEGLSLALRHMEILFLAHRLRGTGHSVPGFADELAGIARWLTQAETMLDDQGTPDDIDLEIYARRVDLLRAAVDADQRIDSDNPPSGAA